MAVVAGNTGNLVFTGGVSSDYGNLDSHIFRWEATIGNDEYKSTTFVTSATLHSFEMGLYTVDGDAEGFMDSHELLVETSDLAANPTALPTLTLTSFTGQTIAFAAILSSIRLTVNKQSGLNKLEFHFRSSGDVTFT